MRIGVFGFLALVTLFSCGGESAETNQTSSAPAIQFERVSADEVAHGERVSRVLGCNGCHGEALTGEDWSEPGFGSLWTAHLTRSVPRYDDRQLAGIITGGRRPDGVELWGMPSHLFTALAPDDMAALIAYLRSRPPAGEVHPAPVFEEGARCEIAAGAFDSSAAQVAEEGASWPPDAGAGRALGRYIVRATCAECHGMDLRGGRPNPDAVLRPDLRMVGAYEREQFHRLLRTGIAAGERNLGLMGEVARGRYSHLTDQGVEAIRLYLQAVAAQP